MFVNISPAIYNVGESICSLGFAARCRSVELGQAKKNVDDGTRSAKKAPSSSSGESSSVMMTPAKTPLSSGTVRRTSSAIPSSARK